MKATLISKENNRAKFTMDFTAEEFEAKMTAFQSKLSDLFQQSHALEQEIEEQMRGLKYD